MAANLTIKNISDNKLGVNNGCCNGKKFYIMQCHIIQGNGKQENRLVTIDSSSIFVNDSISNVSGLNGCLR